MGPEQRRSQMRQIQAEAINSELLNDMIYQETPGHFHIKSFTDENIPYDIHVENNQMISCSCRDFQFNNIAYKRMYLLSRLYTDIIPVQRSSLRKAEFAEQNENNEDITVVDDVTNGDNLTNIMTNMLETMSITFYF
ncbi:MAG: hypothetical protein EXX96DRAFT_613426 [Benjaminiella poitrasii]|nr:MAG: hypothetical protein EXX96DRAFT_613426 [Benjaminiella poitrasii]